MAWIVVQAKWPEDLGLFGPYEAGGDDSVPEDATLDEPEEARTSPYRFRIANDAGEVAIEGRSSWPVEVEGLWFQFERCRAFEHGFDILLAEEDGKWIRLN